MDKDITRMLYCLMGERATFFKMAAIRGLPDRSFKGVTQAGITGWVAKPIIRVSKLKRVLSGCVAKPMKSSPWLITITHILSHMQSKCRAMENIYEYSLIIISSKDLYSHS